MQIKNTIHEQVSNTNFQIGSESFAKNTANEFFKILEVNEGNDNDKDDASKYSLEKNIKAFMEFLKKNNNVYPTDQNIQQFKDMMAKNIELLQSSQAKIYAYNAYQNSLFGSNIKSKS